MLPSDARARFRKLLNIFQLGDAASLRSAMDECRCIISGSAALYMFHPKAFIPADIDFYVPRCGALDFEYALYQRGYKPVNRNGEPKEPQYPSDAIFTVLRLYKVGVAQSLNLVITRDHNPFSAVTAFHSTLVMNAITSDAVVSLYPFLTLSGRGLINIDNPATRRCFAKYIERGFQLSVYASAWWPFAKHDCATSGYCNGAQRSLEDQDVLSIPFDPTHTVVNQNFTPFSWRLSARECDMADRQH